MSHLPSQPPVRDRLTSYFRSGDVIRSRRVSNVVLTGVLDIPVPPTRLLADWEREINANLMLEAGDVEVMPLARTRARWPHYAHCVQAASDWTGTLGMPGLLAASDVALMACRGARYHHDGAQYGAAAFCNLFLSEDKGLDLHFPALDYRIALTRGTVVLFDPSQPHGVIPRDGSGFDASDFAAGTDCSQLFLTWELAVEDTGVGQALVLSFDTAASTALQLDEEQVWWQDARALVCPASGRWRRAD